MNAPKVFAHCDGPCGIYDPASARVAAEAVLSMTKKLLSLHTHGDEDPKVSVSYHNTLARYVAIKEGQAELTKHELLVLWTDFFKPAHLEQFPDLHDVFWNAAKLCSACKQEVSLEKAEALLKTVEKIHEMFWKAKGRDVAWVAAGG